MQRILIMGLPNSGKTTLTNALKNYLSADVFNADIVRQNYKDWDFSRDGRLRQAKRMRTLCDTSNKQFVIADFVAPLQESRSLFNGDWVVWVDTISQSNYKDTDDIFQPPNVYDFRITEKNAERWAPFIGEKIAQNKRRPNFDWSKETVQLLGRWQPWHRGHRALFDRAIQKTGQVVVQVRGCCGSDANNPYGFDAVKNFIDRDLEPLYQGQYIVQPVPNITNITYGRKVGYTIDKETFSDDVESVSATKIRLQSA